MNKLKITLLLIVSLLFLVNCTKETVSNKFINPIEISLKNTETFSYNFRISGDEEGASIIKQAKHYKISDIIRNAETQWSVYYHYKPLSGFVGTDSVLIETCTMGETSETFCTVKDTAFFVFTVSGE